MGLRVCLWGKGKGISRVVRMLTEQGVEVLAIFDSNQFFWGQNVCGVEVQSPKRLMEYDADYLLVTCLPYKAVTKAAVEMGFDGEKSLSFYGDYAKTLETLDVSHCLWSKSYTVKHNELTSESRRHKVDGKATHDIPCPVAPNVHMQIVDAALQAFLQACKDRKKAPPVYKTGERWEKLLDAYMMPLYLAAADKKVDDLAALLGNFCRLRIGTALFGGENEYNELVEKSDFDHWLNHDFELWQAAVEHDIDLKDVAMPPIGNPYGYMVDGHLISRRSFADHARARRLSQLLKPVSKPIVAEVGGGFGGFAYHLIRQNQDATYIDFELPENMIFGAYFSSMAFPDKQILLYQGPDMDLSPENLRRYDAVFLPSFMLPKMQDRSVDLFVNASGFSEMDYVAIKEYFGQIERIGANFFYHENLSEEPDFAGYPVDAFPKLKGFRRVYGGVCAWHGQDVASGRLHLETLFQRCSEA